MSMTWEHRLVWQDYVIDHLDITCVSPARAALPITETGYRSLFIDESHLIEAGGVVAYVTAWLEEASRSPEWRAQAAAARQGSLF